MPSFDVVSRVDLQEMDNAVNQVKKEVDTRYDFNGSKTTDRLRPQGREARRPDRGRHEAARARRTCSSARWSSAASTSRPWTSASRSRPGATCCARRSTIAEGIDIEIARKVVKAIKDRKLKVQAAIQGDEVRVTGKKRDDLQEVIALLKEQDFGIPLQFVNMRE